MNDVLFVGFTEHTIGFGGAESSLASAVICAVLAGISLVGILSETGRFITVLRGIGIVLFGEV
jgi:hypothetical protein